jgi:hypothetical protein
MIAKLRVNISLRFERSMTSGLGCQDKCKFAAIALKGDDLVLRRPDGRSAILNGRRS